MIIYIECNRTGWHATKGEHYSAVIVKNADRKSCSFQLSEHRRYVE